MKRYAEMEFYFFELTPEQIHFIGNLKPKLNPESIIVIVKRTYTDLNLIDQIQI